MTDGKVTNEKWHVPDDRAPLPSAHRLLPTATSYREEERSCLLDVNS